MIIYSFIAISIFSCDKKKGGSTGKNGYGGWTPPTENFDIKYIPAPK